MNGAVEVGGFAAQRVDPLGRRDGAGEHGGLDLVDVAFEFGDDRRVPVHHLIQDRPQRRDAARGEQLRPLLQPLSGLAELARHALPYGDHEGGREEDADLAELDFLGGVVVARGAQDDQPHILVIQLGLRPHVEVLGVLDRQLMQAEGVPDLGQLFVTGFEQSQPHEAALPAAGRRFLQRHRALIAPAAVLVIRTINDHLGTPLSPARAHTCYTACPSSMPITWAVDDPAGQRRGGRLPAARSRR